MIMAQDYPSTEIEKANNRYQGNGDNGRFIEAGPAGGHLLVNIWRPYHVAEIIVTHWRSGLVFYLWLSTVSVNKWRRNIWLCWGRDRKWAQVVTDRIIYNIMYKGVIIIKITLTVLSQIHPVKLIKGRIPWDVITWKNLSPTLLLYEGNPLATGDKYRWHRD